MIDRDKVARAIYDAEDPNSGDAIATTIHLTELIPPHGTIDEQLEQVMETCRSAADAAIAAVLSQLREPSEAMIEAGWHAWHESPVEQELRDDCRALWQAMLDAAFPTDAAAALARTKHAIEELAATLDEVDAFRDE